MRAVNWSYESREFTAIELEHTGVDASTKGAHQFRHALASQMLRHGASLTIRLRLRLLVTPAVHGCIGVLVFC